MSDSKERAMTDEQILACFAQTVGENKTDYLLRVGRAIETQARAQQQAASGVPAVVTEEMHAAACKVLIRAHGLDGLPQRMLDAMIAAAATPTVPADATRDSVCWDLFPAWLIDHCEGMELTEEMLQRAVADMLASDAYQALAKLRRGSTVRAYEVPADTSVVLVLRQMLTDAKAQDVLIEWWSAAEDALGGNSATPADVMADAEWIACAIREVCSENRNISVIGVIPLAEAIAARAAEKGTT